METMKSVQSIDQFIHEWLNHFSIPFEKDVKTIGKNGNLNFLLPDHSMGILIPDWKRPISVQIINKSMKIQKHLNLNEILIVANSVSDHAKETIERLKLPITTIHPNGLSEIAMKFVSLRKLACQLISSE
jgi:hypothetical protein